MCLVFPWVCSKKRPCKGVKQHRVARERVVLEQRSAALLPRLPFCRQLRQSPLPSLRDKTLHESPFFWHVLRGQRVPGAGGHPRSPPSGPAAGQSWRLHRRGAEGEERGCARPARDAQTLCSGGGICRFSPHVAPVGSQRGARGHPRAVPSSVLPRGCCGRGAGCASHGGFALPQLVFSPPQQHAGGLLSCWGGTVMYLLTCYILAKTNKMY